MFNAFVYVMAAIWITVGLLATLGGDPTFGLFAVFCGTMAIGFIKGWL